MLGDARYTILTYKLNDTVEKTHETHDAPSRPPRIPLGQPPGAASQPPIEGEEEPPKACRLQSFKKPS